MSLGVQKQYDMDALPKSSWQPIGRKWDELIMGFGRGCCLVGRGFMKPPNSAMANKHGTVGRLYVSGGRLFSLGEKEGNSA